MKKSTATATATAPESIVTTAPEIVLPTTENPVTITPETTPAPSFFFEKDYFNEGMDAGIKFDVACHLRHLYARNLDGTAHRYTPKAADFAARETPKEFRLECDRLASALCAYVNAPSGDAHAAVKAAVNKCLGLLNLRENVGFDGLSPEGNPIIKAFTCTNSEARLLEASALTVRRNMNATAPETAYRATVKDSIPNLIYDYIFRLYRDIDINAVTISDKATARLDKAAAAAAATAATAAAPVIA